MECHLMRVDKSCALNGKIGGSEEQVKFGFPATAVTACRANFKKSYLTQF